MSLMQWLSHHRLDIACLQETHAVSASESSAWFSPFGFLTVSSVGSARARGLVILYRPRLILNRSWVELCGRFSMAEFTNGNFLFRVVCIYAPRSNPERTFFLLSFADLIDPVIPTLLCGEFNAVWDRTKDRRGSSNDSTYRDCSASLHYLFSEACVFDVWRSLHPDTIAFSWKKRDGLLASRTDLFGCPLSWAHGESLAPIPITLLLCLGFLPLSSSFGALGVGNTIRLFCWTQIFYLSLSLFGPGGGGGDFRSIQLWWDRGKEHLTGLAIRFCSRKKALQERERVLLVNLAFHLKGKIDQGSVSFTDIYEKVLARIADFDCLKVKGARIRARVQWAEEGEMSSRYFYRLEKKRGTEQWIDAIRGTDGKVFTDIYGICRSWVDFFSTLLSSDELDIKVQEDLLGNLSVRLPSSSSASCDGPITLDEAWKALEGAAIGRLPGSDGLSAEFFLAFWNVLGEDLVDVFNASFSSGHLPLSLQGHSWFMTTTCFLPLYPSSPYMQMKTVIALSDTAILEVFRLYARFEAGTGSKLNLSKCKGLWLGPWRFRTNPPVDIQCSSSKLKVIGVFISYDEMGEVNWRPRVEGFCRCIDAWRSRALSFFGRAVVLNSLALSKIWYVALVVAMPKCVLKELNTRIFNFFLGR